MPNKDDIYIVVGIIVIYSYIDFHLKRFVEGLEQLGRVEKVKGKRKRSTAEVAAAVQSAH